MQIGKATFLVKLDTGAGASVLSHADYMLMSPKPKKTVVNVKLLDYSDQVIPIDGMCHVKVPIGPRWYMV